MISQTLERRQVVDFTTYTFVDELTLLSHTPKEKSKDYLVVEPFDDKVWALCFLTAVLTLTFLQVINSLDTNIKLSVLQSK